MSASTTNGFYGSSNPMSMDVVFHQTDLTPDQFLQQQMDQMYKVQGGPALPPPRDPQYAGMPDDMYNAMMEHQQRVGLFGIDQPVERSWDRWMAEQRQQQQQPQLGMPMEPTPIPTPIPTPGQQLNTPSFDQLAQTPMGIPPAGLIGIGFNDPGIGQIEIPPPSVPMATQPPPTQQLVQQIQAPTPSLPTTQQPPATQQLINQIRKPTAATQKFAQQFRAPAPRAPAPRAPAPRPAAPPQARPTFQPQIRSAARPMARSVSRVNPPLSTRPTGRR